MENARPFKLTKKQNIEFFIAAVVAAFFILLILLEFAGDGL